jgi:hypothetical protein
MVSNQNVPIVIKIIISMKKKLRVKTYLFPAMMPILFIAVSVQAQPPDDQVRKEVMQVPAPLTVEDLSIGTCPRDTIVNCGESIAPSNIGFAAAAGLCSSEPEINYFDVVEEGTCALGQVITRTWVAVDNCGGNASCVQVIRVNPPSAPAFHPIPGGKKIGCDDSDPEPSFLNFSNASWEISTKLFRVNAGGPELAAGSHSNWETDQSGMNSAYLVDSGSNSTFSTSQSIQLHFSVPAGTPEALFQTERFDLGGGTEMQYAFPGLAQGTVVRVNLYLAEIFIGADGSGKRIFDVAVEGIVPPEFNGIDPWTIANALNGSNGGMYYGFVLSSTAVVMDGVLNIEFRHIVQNPAVKGIEITTQPTTCLIEGEALSTLEFHEDDCLGYWEETWSFTDECDRTVTATRIIEISPVIFCPPNVTIDCSEVPVPSFTGFAVASDNCDDSSSITYTDQVVPGVCFQERTIVRTWRAVNDCGNTADCLQTVSVKDTKPPVFTHHAADQTAECAGPGNYSDLEEWLNASGGAAAFDNCGIVSWSNDFNGFAGGCGSVTVTFTASDGCGNTATTTATFTILDLVPPTGACPSGITGLDFPSQIPPIDLEAVAAGFSDNCGDVFATLMDVDTVGNACTGFNITFMLEIADECGNTVPCAVSYTGGGVDEIPLTGTCLEGINNLTCLGDVPPPNPAAVAAGFTGTGIVGAQLINTIAIGDECSGFSVYYEYEVFDECGNSFTCQVTHSGSAAVTGECPSGLSGLICIHDVPPPDPEAVAAAYRDGCEGSGITAVLLNTITSNFRCDGFSVSYVYAVTSDCGFFQECMVTHSGTNCLSDCEVDGEEIEYSHLNPGGFVNSTYLPGTPQIKVYPNPSSGSLNVSLRDFGNEKIRIAIFNVFGEMVFSSLFDESGDALIRIDLLDSGLPDGAYFLRVDSGEHTAIEKFILTF